MLSIMLLKVLFSFFIKVALAQGAPWADIEQQIQIKQKKLEEINQDILQRMKPQFKQTPDEAEHQFVLELSSLKEEKMLLQEEIEKLSQELNYRFPERGIKLSPVSEQSGSTGPVDLPADSDGDTKSLQIKKNTVDQTMKVLRRQFGEPVPASKPSLVEPVETRSDKKSTLNPIDDKIIISK